MTMVERSPLDEAAAFREELLAAGLLLPSGTDGIYGRSAEFEAVAEGLLALLARTTAGMGTTKVRFPPVMPRSVFEHTDYLKSFPDLTGSVHTFMGGDRDHAKLLAAAEAGEDWTGHLTPADAHRHRLGGNHRVTDRDVGGDAAHGAGDPGDHRRLTTPFWDAGELTLGG